MTNLVLWLHYRLTGDAEHHAAYGELVNLSLESVRANLQGDWEPMIVGGDYSDRSFAEAYSDMYRDFFFLLRKHHGLGDNVLFLDPDVVCVKPTEIFGRFAEMRLFWHTDPASRLHFDPYLNGGIVYIPASMHPGLWRIVQEWAWTMRQWNDSQDILNHMFYEQRPIPELHPELNWSPHVPSPIDRDQARLLHFNSTRGPEDALAAMRDALASTAV